VPAGIDGLSSLEDLDLSLNMLSGPIPYQIGECSKLRFLSLGRNRLNRLIWTSCRFTRLARFGL
jgi:Leucine-rich repeat (LRR) protein